MVSSSAAHHMTPATLSVPVCGAKRSFAAMQPTMESLHAADPTQKRSPLLCGYPSKKCWAWRVEKRNGELHKFCEYHRQKANTNQRRMEQRRKTGRSAQKGEDGDDGDDDEATADADASTIKEETTSTTAAPSTPVKTQPPTINTALANAEKVVSATRAFNNKELMTAGSPRGVDSFDNFASPPLFSWAEVDLDIGMDAAVEYMMIDHAIDAEPSDKPVDLYEEDLYFLEHFIAEIAASGV